MQGSKSHDPQVKGDHLSTLRGMVMAAKLYNGSSVKWYACVREMPECGRAPPSR